MIYALIVSVIKYLQYSVSVKIVQTSTITMYEN